MKNSLKEFKIKTKDACTVRSFALSTLNLRYIYLGKTYWKWMCECLFLVLNLHKHNYMLYLHSNNITLFFHWMGIHVHTYIVQNALKLPTHQYYFSSKNYKVSFYVLDYNPFCLFYGKFSFGFIMKSNFCDLGI